VPCQKHKHPTVSEHIVQGNLTLNTKPAVIGFRIQNSAVALVNVSQHGGLELLGPRHFDQHDGLDEAPHSLVEGLLHGALRGQNERELRRVGHVVGAVLESEPHARDFVSRQTALFQRHVEALFYGWNKVALSNKSTVNRFEASIIIRNIKMAILL